LFGNARISRLEITEAEKPRQIRVATCFYNAATLGHCISECRLGRAILASDEFARYCPGEFTALGELGLAGFSVPQLIYNLADSV
jgi:hypothetical protein